MGTEKIRPYPAITVSDKAAKSAVSGHPWIYGGEILSAAPAPLPSAGELADIYTKNGRYLGTGFYNPTSKISLRIVTRSANDRPHEETFWRRRVDYALRYRKSVMPGEDFYACRLLFAEADGFPGMVADRFGEVLTVQVHSLGMDRYKEYVINALCELLAELGAPVKGVYERSEGELRRLEGMEDSVGERRFPGEGAEGLPAGNLPSGNLPAGDAEIVENGLRFLVDYREGQKTGFFLDQKYNRLAVRRIAAGRTVLDCCTHTGAFALNAAAGGAKSVTALDISATSLARAEENAALNRLNNVHFVRADLFDYLRTLEKKGGHPYDLIILDPPAFTKSRDTAKSAYRGYLEINRLAMRLLPRGGYLATCSCSHFMRENYFKAMLSEAAAAAGVSLRQLEARQQAPDHPILWGFPESGYLKFFLFQVV